MLTPANDPMFKQMKGSHGENMSWHASGGAVGYIP